MGRNKQRIYTERQWKEADPVDRMYMHLLEPTRWILSPHEEDRLDRLRKVWAIMCDKATAKERIRLISEIVDVTERTVYRDMQDAANLFGDILKYDIELELRLSYERYMLLFEKAFIGQDYDTARRIQDSALEVLAKLEARTPKKSKKYPEIVFTSDPAALRARNDIEGEEIDFDEIPNATGILEREADRISEGN